MFFTYTDDFQKESKVVMEKLWELHEKPVYATVWTNIQQNVSFI